MTTENLLLTVGMLLYFFASVVFIKGKINEIKEIEGKFSIKPIKQAKVDTPCID